MYVPTLLLLLIAPPPPGDGTLVYDTDRLDLRTCRSLDGQRVVVRAHLRWMSLTASDFRYGVVNDRLELTLWTSKTGPDHTGRTVTAEATVRVLRHPRQGQRQAYTEVRLVDAVVRSVGEGW